jgi:hypothetical protein
MSVSFSTASLAVDAQSVRSGLADQPGKVAAAARPGPTSTQGAAARLNQLLAQYNAGLMKQDAYNPVLDTLRQQITEAASALGQTMELPPETALSVAKASASTGTTATATGRIDLSV